MWVCLLCLLLIVSLRAAHPQGKGLADKGKFTEAEVAAMENVE